MIKLVCISYYHGTIWSCSPLCGWIKVAARALNVITPVHADIIGLVPRLRTTQAYETRIWRAVVMVNYLLAFCTLTETIRDPVKVLNLAETANKLGDCLGTKLVYVLQNKALGL